MAIPRLDVRLQAKQEKHTVERERDVLCKECQKDYRIGIAKDDTCERRDDPMRFASARPTEDL